MSASPFSSLRSFLGLAVGLAVGVIGAVLVMQSMPPPAGSAEEKVARMEVELKSARNRITALEAADPYGTRKPGSTFRDRARTIAQRLKAGETITPDDILRTMQPVMRDLAPLFDRIRVRDQMRRIDSMCGELARKYDLTPDQIEKLKGFFEKRAEEEAKQFNAVVLNDHATLRDFMKASRNIRPDDGLDQAMAGLLDGDKLASFRKERLEEKATRVQQEADMKLERLDSIVGLDETQRDQVFALMARNSRDYDPAMSFEGVEAASVSSLPQGNASQAMMSILRPEQRQAYEKQQQDRREKAEKDLQEIGLSLPADWDMLDDEFL